MTAAGRQTHVMVFASADLHRTSLQVPHPARAARTCRACCQHVSARLFPGCTSLNAERLCDVMWLLAKHAPLLPSQGYDDEYDNAA